MSIFSIASSSIHSALTVSRKGYRFINIISMGSMPNSLYYFHVFSLSFIANSRRESGVQGFTLPSGIREACDFRYITTSTALFSSIFRAACGYDYVAQSDSSLAKSKIPVLSDTDISAYFCLPYISFIIRLFEPCALLL